MSVPDLLKARSASRHKIPWSLRREMRGPAPLTAVQLLWVNLIMDTLSAWALATEPPNDGLMNRPPVGRGVSFITKAMWRNIIGQSIYQLVVLGVLGFDGKNLLRLEGSDATKVFNWINSRGIEKINVFQGMFSSWIFIAVMVSTVAFQVIIVQFLGTFASTVPLSWQFWLLSILIGAVSMPISVVLKCIPVKIVTRRSLLGPDLV
ncbi:autoinhibited Ca2+-ATPase 11 [Actinidia rufa]|uniref:Autoinhibited Ca2+-ATPase 11 n=1 Tax=Actinidia rufa TaxID=165716 RepID=A0A7J0FHM1_9ERIC|nr:autoinhibited Ca2+-ATPase 11 [Actinidia rufa]